MLEVKFEDLPKGGWEVQEEKLREIRATGEQIHLIYDRRVSPTRRPVSENKYVIFPGLTHQCHKVSIISETGEVEILKDRIGTPIEAGRTYIAKNQGRAITPRELKVTVVSIENGHVHYRLEGQTEVKQTPMDRFLEIIGDNRG